MHSKFTKLPRFEDGQRTARVGLQTSDDFRFVRAWWEVASTTIARSRDETFQQKCWTPFAKGGEYSPYYADIYLVLNWKRDGEEIKAWAGSLYSNSHWSRIIKNVDHYFRPGLTWPRRTDGLSFRVLPAQGIFADKGPAAFVWEDDSEQLLALAAILNSSPFYFFVKMLLARVSLAQSFEVGLVQSLPVPDLSEEDKESLAELSLRCINIKRDLDSANETSHAFCLPALLQTNAASLGERIILWRDRISSSEQQFTEHQRAIDDFAFQLYSIEDEDRWAIEDPDVEDGTTVSPDEGGSAETEGEEEATAVLDGSALAANLLSYAVGCVFGRWDARIALDPSLAPELADPFAPLPVCSPGMLVGSDGLSAKRDGIASEEWMRARPAAITPPPEGSVEDPTIPNSEYPLAVDWDGILVDDPDHTDDLVRRVRDVLILLWGERADEIEGEACDLLGVKDLRTFFRNPRQFFDHHIKRYSKSRRKAPIYWLLQSPKRHYGLWLYYHRLDPDILFKALHKYVEPKIRLEEDQLAAYEAQRRSVGTGGREAKQAEKILARQEELLADLREFRDRLERAAKLHLRPDLNDGVVLNIAPLHELVPWKEAKSKWNELLAGKYEWSSIGKQLREKGLV
jgi:hypothetical protein